MTTSDVYAQAGVDIAAGTRATELMADAVRSTYGPEVLAGLGAFGGLYDAGALKRMAAPVLVASTDGVGTKTKVAGRMRRWEGVGHDIVHHCVNDILVQGARPLFFLDYVASARIDPQHVATLVGSVAEACRAHGCALLGGETAEMPAVYQAGEVDLVGTIVGVVERAEVIDGSRIVAGDVVLGLPSNGLHTNGYSLARRVLDGLDWEAPHPALGCSVGEALLRPHTSYAAPVQRLWGAGVDIRGLAHITGGGLRDNPPRILPEGLGMRLRRGAWPVPPIFRLIQEAGGLAEDQLLHVFNMGLGMLAVVPPAQAELALAALPGACYRVGEIVAGQAGVQLEGGSGW